MSPSSGPGGVHTVLAVNFNHDGAAVLLNEGEIVGFVCTERFSRLKKHPGIRDEDLDELLDQSGLGLNDVDVVLLCNLHNMDSPDIPRMHGSDLKDTFLPFRLDQRFSTVELRGRSFPCVVNPDHHLLHAAAAFYTSPYGAAVALAVDPTGCRAFAGRDGRLWPLDRGYDAWFNANIGYNSVSDALFASTITGAGKVMGLAPFGGPAEPPDVDWRSISTFARLRELASIDPVPVDVDGRELNAALAYYVQLGLELQMSAVLDDLDVARRDLGIGPNLCLSGGTALNAVATQACFAGSPFERLHLHPACGDDGTAIGAALWFWHHELGRPRREFRATELMYSVRRYSDVDVRAALAPHTGRLTVEHTPRYLDRCAELIAGGAAVGWFDGASEIGPRALGHRSLLADPRDPGMKDRLNARIKQRERFRPFAPSVLDEHATSHFGLRDSPFMLRACQVLTPGLPAVTHVDGTSRIQTVRRDDNPTYHALITRLHELTGVPIVLNTSLNAHGEPIVETPADAVRMLLETELDSLVFPGVVVGKSPQPSSTT